MRSPLAICGLCCCVVSLAQPIAPGDPAIGGYFYFAALDRKCPAPDAERAAALERFKRHFVAGFRPLAQSYGAAGSKALQMLEDLERNGPSDEELVPFEPFFARASQGELAQICAEMAKQIDQRIALENRIREGLRK